MTDLDSNVTQDNTGDDDAPTSGHTGMKILVIVLGLAIVVMLILIIGKIVTRMGGDAPATSPLETSSGHGQTSAGGKAMLQADGRDIVINKPEGSELVRLEVSGSLISAHFMLSDGSDAVALVDGNTGEILRWIRVPAN